MQKSKKPRENQKKTRHFYFCTSPGIFLCFFCFLEVFWNFHFYCYCMLCFFVFFLFCLFLFFLFFLFNRAKSFLVELWADKRVQKVDLGGVYIYIYFFLNNIYIYTLKYIYIFIYYMYMYGGGGGAGLQLTNILCSLNQPTSRFLCGPKVVKLASLGSSEVENGDFFRYMFQCSSWFNLKRVSPVDQYTIDGWYGT